MRLKPLFLTLPVGLATLASLAVGQNTPSNEHWVATWATALQLVPNRPGGRGAGRGGPAPGAPAAPAATGSQAATASQATPNAPQSTAAPAPQAAPGGQGAQQGRGGRGSAGNAQVAPLSDQTVRMIVHTSLGGRQVRVELSNMLTADPIEVGAAHIAIHKGGGAIEAGTDRALTFSGHTSITIPSGALILSDPVNLQVAPMSDLAVSLYLPHDTGVTTVHPLSLHTTYISKGDVTASESMPEPQTNLSYVWLSSVDVLAPLDAFTVVALGDSITDGFATTPNTDRAWPTLLAKRFQGNKATQHVAVVNQGISGNQVLRDGAGVSALARLDRDVIARPGVKWVVLLEAINDINIRGRAEGPQSVTSDELIAGYRQIIERCHTYGIQVMGATIMPDEGVPTATERGEKIRQEINAWIRAKGNFDAVVDFDKVVQDPAKPTRIRPELDPGDHIHPNDAANQLMADAFDLSVFKKR